MSPADPMRVGVAVDIVIFTVVDDQLQVLLAERPHEPFAGAWSLPGGFVGATESADEAAVRELQRKVGLADVFLEQLYTFSAPDRDPRSRVVSVAYYALIAAAMLGDEQGTRDRGWFALSLGEDGIVKVGGEPRELAFDHALILRTAIERVRGKLDYAPLGFQLLPDEFTLSELQQVHEAILGHQIDKRNFRSKLKKSGLVKQLDTYRKGAHRPARLYRFVAP